MKLRLVSGVYIGALSFELVTGAQVVRRDESNGEAEEAFAATGQPCLCGLWGARSKMGVSLRFLFHTFSLFLITYCESIYAC